MRTRVIVLRITVAILTFLLGVAAAVLIGHINPFQSATRHCNVEQRLVIAPLAEELPQGYHGCPHARTAELRSNTRIVVVPRDNDVTIMQAPSVEMPPPPAPVAPRASHRR